MVVCGGNKFLKYLCESLKQYNMSIEELIDIAEGIYTKESPEVKDLLIHIEAMNDLIAKGAIHNYFGLNEIEILALIMLEEFAYNTI